MPAPQAAMDALERRVAPTLSEGTPAHDALVEAMDALALLQGAFARTCDEGGEERWEASLVDARRTTHALVVLLYADGAEAPGEVLVVLRDLSALTGRCVEA